MKKHFSHQERELSDHNPFLITISSLTHNDEKATPIQHGSDFLDFGVFSLNNVDWITLNKYILEHPFQPYCYSNIDHLINSWYLWLYIALEKHMKKQTKHRMNLAPWITPETSNIIKRLNTASKKVAIKKLILITAILNDLKTL